ncbi:hypothetical protein [Desulfovibrio sp. DV]|uniref:hypothetical protein n=1 Tax=Desulfovibrio sp. DV TaxID=1844708 RepID=UPI00094BA825|nr:hypothetical protein [Desulfovibrio sp. DV]
MAKFFVFALIFLSPLIAEGTVLKVAVDSGFIKKMEKSEPRIHEIHGDECGIKRQSFSANAWNYEVASEKIYSPLSIMVDETLLDGFSLKPLTAWVPYNRDKPLFIALHPQEKKQNVFDIADDFQFCDLSDKDMTTDTLFEYYQTLYLGFKHVMEYRSIKVLGEKTPSKGDILIVFKFIQAKLRLAEILVLDEDQEELNQAYQWLEYVKNRYHNKLQEALASGMGAENQYKQIFELKKGVKNKIMEEMWTTISAEKDNEKKLALLTEYNRIVKSFITEEEYRYFNKNCPKGLRKGIILSTTAGVLSKVIKNKCKYTDDYSPRFSLRQEDKKTYLSSSRK